MIDTTKKISVPASDKFDIAYSTYFQSEKVLPHRQNLNERSKPMSSPELSYRVINHWEKNGLIDVERGEAAGWRKYSAMDAIWINLMIELRKFGVSIENIRKIREQLTARNELYRPSIYPLLEFYTSLFMRYKEETYILIPDNFVIEIATQSEIELVKSMGGMCNHISISLHDIIKTVYQKHDIKLKEDKRVELSSEELALIYEIRTAAYKAINVKMKNGKIIRLEKDVQLTEKQVYKLLQDKNYDSITIERQDGKVVDIKQIIKDQF
jgi:DNA-binding transcriptional MerR regulator